jgi:hypothetical protein
MEWLRAKRYHCRVQDDRYRKRPPTASPSRPRPFAESRGKPGEMNPRSVGEGTMNCTIVPVIARGITDRAVPPPGTAVAPNVSLASGQAGCLFPASLPRHLACPEARTTRPRAPAAGDSATWCGPFAPATLLVPARLGLRDRPAPARRLPPLRRPDSVRFRPRHSTPPPATPISPDHVQLAGSVRRGGPAALRSAS